MPLSKEITDAIDAKYFLAAIVESSQDSIISVDFNGTVTTWNAGAEELYGYSAAEAVGNNLYGLVFPNELRNLLGNIENVKRSRKVEVFESIRLDKSGRDIVLEVVMSPVKDERGQVIGVSTIARDMTRRRQAETALRLFEEKFRSLVLASSYAVYEMSADWSEMRTLEGLQFLFDTTNPSVSWLEEYIPEEERVRVQTAIEKAIATRSIFELEHRVVQRDGTLGWTLSRALPLLDAHQEITSWIGSASDITQRKESEAKVRQSEERLRHLVDGIQHYAMFLMDPQRRIYHWNRGAEILFGWDRKEAVGRCADMIFTPEDRAAGMPEQETQTALENGFVPDIRWHLRRDGSRFWAEGINTCLRDENGNVRGFAKIARDATKQREAEEELQRAHHDLERRVAERTEQLEGEVVQRRELEAQRTQLMQRALNAQEEERRRVARELHDNLGQHLTAIMLGIEALKTQSSELPGEERRTAISGLDRLYAMINDLTGVAHRLAWELRPAALDNIGLEAALQQYLEQWGGQNGPGQALTTDFASRLAEKEIGISPEAEIALYRITQEALTNVLRHARASQVSVILERHDGFVTVIIEDNGQGFDQEAATQKNRLGLLGMRERMELAGGTLELESEPGNGTTVYARVPLITPGP